MLDIIIFLWMDRCKMAWSIVTTDHFPVIIVHFFLLHLLPSHLIKK